RGIVGQRPLSYEILISSLTGFPTPVHQLLALGLDEAPDFRILPAFLHEPKNLIVARQITNHVPGRVTTGPEFRPLTHKPRPRSCGRGGCISHRLSRVLSAACEFSAFEQIQRVDGGQVGECLACGGSRWESVGGGITDPAVARFSFPKF